MGSYNGSQRAVIIPRKFKLTKVKLLLFVRRTDVDRWKINTSLTHHNVVF